MAEDSTFTAPALTPGDLPWRGRAVLLVDLDAFFASVEQLDHPAWRGKPVIVGGDADKHGVVSTASYEARAFGVHSAMPASTARQLCPQGIWTGGHFDRYRQMSNAIMGILGDETPHVQQVSIDEAFCDVSPTAINTEHPADIARRIQQRVAQLGVTCSIGVGSTKTVAKIASDQNKPRGLVVVYPGTEQSFLWPLPIRVLSGIGSAAEDKLRRRGIRTLGDLAARDESELVRLFGKAGRVMHIRANGGDDSEIRTSEPVKSVSNETTFATDLRTAEDVNAAIATMAAKVGRRLRKKMLKGTTVGLKVRFADRSVRNAQRRLDHPTDDELEFTPVLTRLAADIWSPGAAVRLVGVSVTGFAEQGAVQQSLFDVAEAAPSEQDVAPLVADDEKRKGLLAATDLVRNRFGESAVQYGREIRSAGNTTGSSSKNPEDYK